MTAITIREPGTPDVLDPETRPLPQARGRDILVQVAAAGVNRPDILQRQGSYNPPPGAPDIPGLEISGDIVAIGEAVEQYRVGDRVCALVAGGGYAEYCAAHELHALPVPSTLSLIEAAAVPETYFTVWTNVFERGALKAGECLLVHGGTSGIGTTAILLAKAFGATVIATAGSSPKCEACRSLGADVAVNYKTADWVAETKSATGGKGADVILDMVGYGTQNYQAAAEQGRIVQIAHLAGAVVSQDLRLLMMKRLVHTGSTLRPRSVAEKAAIAGALKQNVWPLLSANRCKPVIDSTFALRSAAQAHARMEAGSHIGKIVLVVRSDAEPP
jgi:NADPH2:quinone reductase